MLNFHVLLKRGQKYFFVSWKTFSELSSTPSVFSIEKALWMKCLALSLVCLVSVSSILISNSHALRPV